MTSPENEKRSEYEIEDWTIAEHVAEACRLLDGPDVSPDEWNAARADNVNTARAYIALAALLHDMSGRRPGATLSDVLEAHR